MTQVGIDFCLYWKAAEKTIYERGKITQINVILKVIYIKKKLLGT